MASDVVLCGRMALQTEQGRSTWSCLSKHKVDFAGVVVGDEEDGVTTIPYESPFGSTLLVADREETITTGADAGFVIFRVALEEELVSAVVGTVAVGEIIVFGIDVIGEAVAVFTGVVVEAGSAVGCPKSGSNSYTHVVTTSVKSFKSLEEVGRVSVADSASKLNWPGEISMICNVCVYT